MSSAAPRTFLAAAPEDSLINPERNTRQMATKLQAVGVPVTLQFYPRTNHITLIGAFAGLGDFWRRYSMTSLSL